jgi:hypothetical protein
MRLFLASAVVLISFPTFAATWQKMYVGVSTVCHSYSVGPCADTVFDLRAPKPATVYQDAMSMTEKVSDELGKLNDGIVHVCDAKTDMYLAYPGSSETASSVILQIFDLKNCQ